MVLMLWCAKNAMELLFKNPVSKFYTPTFWFGRSRLELKNHAAFLRNSTSASNAGGPWATPLTDSDLSSAS